ncbi:homoserine dehydrogenase [Gloeobacter kilaueensis]|uniref:(S)-8-amino-7-oxononanoate synthase BioU n=1 Tax=Gloeobacter kilaueensis (strain ATCC BAA-2537 / CCAP 1431/1 / ULC 316 / JS1) TaxID=1183438 RepID=U5QEX2_GLOK1|nr:homoserine dehydrogenase [Gloeobacter kilaueensis]AGY57466.1 homoserine dehydrogenase [Gloeobacter kilaueensis JS1]
MVAIRVGLLGYGGLGQAAGRLLAHKRELQLVAVADSKGYAHSGDGLDAVALEQAMRIHGSVGYLGTAGVLTSDPIEALLAQNVAVDGYFLALPNLPNTFMASVAQSFIASGWRGVLVDAIKRTSAVEQLLSLEDAFKRSGITYITGCGATPGLLTAAAALAAQSFVEVLSVRITFGVGIANWEAYRSTVREDIAHLEGYSTEQARSMSDAEVAALLESTGGLLKLENMEHADDILLERAGICARERVQVGGVVDTRNPQKPLSTNVQLTGRTFEGKISTHSFVLGDETSMAANVCGPAFGYLKTGVELHRRGHYGIWSSADLMPRFAH